MSRKTSKFSRKRQATGGEYDGGVFITVAGDGYCQLGGDGCLKIFSKYLKIVLVITRIACTISTMGRQ